MQDDRKFSFRGQEPKKVSENTKLDLLKANTELKGDFKEAARMMRQINQEMTQTKGKGVATKIKDSTMPRLRIEYEDESSIQLRSEGRSGHPKLEIRDINLKIEEKITFVPK